MAFRYFAYGSALDDTHVRSWAEDHGHPPDLLAEDGLPAAVDDHALAFTVASRYWGGGVGTLEPRPGAVVLGMLFELDDAAAEVIRHKEGARTGLYREVRVEVRVVMGGHEGATMQLLEASAFVATSPGEPVAPSARWLDAVITGARARRLPATWIAELEGFRKGAV